MQIVSLERELARIIAAEEEAAERKSTISRPTERAVIKSLDKMLAWEYTIPAERAYHATAYYTRKVEQRHCEHCSQSLPVSEFKAVKYSPDGLAFWCNRCQRDKQHIRWSDRVAWAGQGKRAA